MLKTLEVYALRGATTPLIINFERNKKITIIYGENGTGKSTICDALEFLGKGTVGSLEVKGLGSGNQRYLPSTGKKPSELSVKLKTAKGEWQGSLSKSKPVIIPDSPRPRIEILRRYQILRLITDQASKRYDAIKPFIDIEGVEQSENALRNLIKEEKKTLDLAMARLQANQTFLEQFWEQDGKPGQTALLWAKSEISKDTSQLNQESHQLEKLIIASSLLIEEESRVREINAQLLKADSELQSAKTLVQQEQSHISDNATNLVEILTAAQHFFEQHSYPPQCPLCGSSEFAKEMPSKVAEQLKTIRSFEIALKTKKTADQSLDIAKNQAERQRSKLLASSHALVSVLKTPMEYSGITLISEILQSTLRFQDNQNDNNAQTNLIQQTGNLLDQAKKAASQREQKIGFLTSLKNAVENFETDYQIHQSRASLIPRLEAALTVVEQTRRQFVDDILREISQRVGELYEAIHPDEGLDKVRLLLDLTKRASLEIESDFPGAQSAPPGAYFSESHLDTLGLCIWLAMMERENSGDKILVLDDVIGSVDEQHADRTIELLYEVSKNFQHCFLTTHYRPWREKYRWGRLRKGECQFIELLDWQHNTGIIHGKHVPQIEELGNLLKNNIPDPQILCARAGVILEYVLHFITDIYQCRVPKNKKLELNDLLTSINHDLLNTLKVEKKEAITEDNEKYVNYPLGPILNYLKNTFQIRNLVGCHYNDLANYFPTEDAIEFASKVYELASLLVDTESDWPTKDDSGSYWSNSSRTVRLHPLKQPK